MTKYEVTKSTFLSSHYWVVTNTETKLGHSFWKTYMEAVNAARDLNKQSTLAPESSRTHLKVVPRLRLVSG